MTRHGQARFVRRRLDSGEVAASDEAGLSPNHVGLVREDVRRTFIAVALRAPFATWRTRQRHARQQQDTDPLQDQLQDTTQISWTFTPAVTGHVRR